MICLDLNILKAQKSLNIMHFGYKKRCVKHVITQETISLVLIFTVISVYLIL